MKHSELKNPDFLFCENPIKTGELVNDNRTFIYCTKYLSLIEIVPMDLYLAKFPDEQFQKTYFYEEEEFLLVFTQNNIEIVNESLDLDIITSKEVIMTNENLMNQAWEYFKNYLTWEDQQ